MSHDPSICIHAIFLSLCINTYILVTSIFFDAIASPRLGETPKPNSLSNYLILQFRGWAPLKVVLTLIKVFLMGHLQYVRRFENRLMLLNHCRLITIVECLGIFWWEIFFTTVVILILLSHGVSILLLKAFFSLFFSDVFTSQLDFYFF